MKKKPSPWFVEAFESAYLRVYAHRNRADAERAVNACLRHLTLKEGETLLDLCSGAGRHIELFRAADVDVVGLDLSADLLAEARRQSSEWKLVRADARVLPFADESFGGLVNLFSSFGYFNDDREHLTMLREMARVVKKGCRVFIDHMNPARIRANLVPESVEERDGLTITSRRSIDEARQRVEKQVKIEEGNEVVSEYQESVRLFAPSDFDALLKNAGLKLIERIGDFDDSVFGEHSPRQILITEKA